MAAKHSVVLTELYRHHLQMEAANVISRLLNIPNALQSNHTLQHVGPEAGGHFNADSGARHSCHHLAVSGTWLGTRSYR